MKGVKQIVKTKTDFNYRKYYKDYYGIKFGRPLDVHHIDGNRGNNNIDNLLLIPSKSHQALHKIDNATNGNINCAFDLVSNSYLVDLSKEEFILFFDIIKWYDVKYQSDCEIKNAKKEGRKSVNFYQSFINEYFETIK